MTIEEFIRARLDEDEAACRNATLGPWRPEEWPIDHGREFLVVSGVEVGAPAFAIKREGDAQHIARHDPASVLRDIAAKRTILAAAERVEENGGWHISGQGVEIVYALAERWSGHPDYRPEWA